MASGTLERCSLHGWIPVFTVQGRWQTACMALCGWAVCWCQCCGHWHQWPMVAMGLWYGQAYVMDNGHRCILLMTFWMHRDTVMRSWDPLLCHSSMTITSCCRMIMHSPMLQGSVHNSWKLKTSLAWPAYSPPRHVTHWACLGCSRSVYTTECSSSCHYPATSHSHLKGVDQHSTGHNQQPDQPCEGEMLHCVRQMVVTPDTDWFSVGLSWQRRSAH